MNKTFVKKRKKERTADMVFCVCNSRIIKFATLPKSIKYNMAPKSFLEMTISVYNWGVERIIFKSAESEKCLKEVFSISFCHSFKDVCPHT